ncbi:MAG: dihydroorotase [Firmicutes bacterium]|nr:dihydroorotase [Bacillota bacterium]
MKVLLKNCSIIDTIYDYKNSNDIMIEDGKISEISRSIYSKADKIVDIDGRVVVPGLIDMHCHLREPGFEYKETIKTGTLAAAKGGYTTVCCMPNTNPVIDNIVDLENLKRIIKKDSVIDTIPIGAVTKNQNGNETVDLKTMADYGVRLFSDDGNPIWNDLIMEECLNFSKKEDILIIDHCEDMGLTAGGVINEGEISREMNLKGISNLSEAKPIIRNIMLAKKTNAPVHIAHVSTAESLEAIEEAKEKGIKVTCEVTPHHISLSENDIVKDNTDFKVNPPLRSKEDVAALQHGLRDGIIDVIATDHAPHSGQDKAGDFYKAANGISGIEIAFSVCFTYLVRTGLLTLKELLRLMSLNPSNLLKLNKGRIYIGGAADLAVIDLYKEFEVKKSDFVSKGKNTPFHGKNLWGEIIMTISGGNIVYEKGEVYGVYR